MNNSDQTANENNKQRNITTLMHVIGEQPLGIRLVTNSDSEHKENRRYWPPNDWQLRWNFANSRQKCKYKSEKRMSPKFGNP